MVQPDDLSFTQHAETRMGQRQISKRQVASALAREIDRRPGDVGSLWIRGQPPGNRVLKVCVSTNDETHVITAAWED